MCSLSASASVHTFLSSEIGPTRMLYPVSRLREFSMRTFTDWDRLESSPWLHSRILCFHIRCETHPFFGTDNAAAGGAKLPKYPANHGTFLGHHLWVYHCR